MLSASLLIYALDEAEVQAENILSDMDTVPILFMRDIPDDEEGVQLLRNGARGYGNSVMSTPVLRQAVDIINSGNIWVYPRLMNRLISFIPVQRKTIGIQGLSSRETEISLLVSEGLSNQEVADKLGVAEITVKKILSGVYSKLKLKDRLGLALYVNKQSGGG